MATNFGTKIAINAFIRDSENVIIYYRGFSWSAILKRILIARF